MSHPEVQKAMRDVIAIGRRVIDETAEDAADDLRKELSVPAVAVADAGFVISSAPGEFPRMRTGRLRASVYDKVAVDDGPRYFRDVGASAYYSPFLEYGTSRMAARPHVAPINEKWRKILEQRLNAAYGR